MSPQIRYWRPLIAACLLWHTVLAYWRVPCGGVAGIGMVDPIVNPGKTASHMHTIKGSSGRLPTACLQGSRILTSFLALAENATVNDLLNAECTSCQIAQDKSAYWTPQLYFQDADGTFELVTELVNHTT